MDRQALYQYQVKGSEFLAQRRHALLADEMGLGKTVQAITAAAAVPKLHCRKLVLCPASVKAVWQQEIATWSRLAMTVDVVIGRMHEVDNAADYVIANYELLRYEEIFEQLKALSFDLLVCDEAHYLKSPSAIRTKAVLGSSGLGKRCDRIWFLTGTPVLNRPIELYPMLKATRVFSGSYRKYAELYCGGYWNGFEFWDKGCTRTSDLNLLLQKFMLRRTKDEVLSELPAKQYQLITLPAKNKKIEDAIAIEFNWKKMPKSVQETYSVTELRQEMALSKVPAAVEHIENTMAQTDKLVVFAYHRSVLIGLRSRLSQYCPVLVWGATPQAKRKEYVDTFQNDPGTRLFLGQLQAAGTGITLHAASRVLFVEPSWVPGEMDQASDRVHRIGQRDSVLIQILVLAGSVEESIMRTQIRKRKNIKEIVER